MRLYLDVDCVAEAKCGIARLCEHGIGFNEAVLDAILSIEPVCRQTVVY